MEIKRMPRSQFLKLNMENNKKEIKKKYREWMQHQEN